MFGVPKRWEMATLIFSGICIVYTLRVNMSVAAVKMKDDLDWSEAEKGYVLSAFYWGYTIGQIPAARLAQEYGAKWVFALSVAIPSAFTLLVPVACRSSFGMALFIRVLIGFFESATFPAMYHFIPAWVPLSEKTFMIPFMVSGCYLGEIIGFSLSGALAGSSILVNGEEWGGWPSIFYVFGAAGLIWFPIFIYAATESPDVHPTITDEEILFINAGKDMPFQGLGRDAEKGLNDALRPLMYDHDEASDIVHPDSVPLTSVTTGAAVRSLSFSDKASESYDTTSSSVLADLEPRSVQNPLTSTTHSATHSNNNTLTQRTHSAALQAQEGEYGFSRNPSRSTSRLASVDRMGNMSKEEWQVLPNDMYALKDNALTKAELTARTPWGVFATDHVALTLMYCCFCAGWVGFTLLSEMPSYLTDVLGFDLSSAGALCVFPYLALFVSVLGFARFFDYMQREHDWSANRVRVTAMFVAYMGSALGLIVCGFLDAKYAAYCFMILTQVFYGSNQSGLACIFSDIAPLYSTSLNTLGNTMSAIAGIVGPIIVSAFVSAWPGVWGWRLAFLLTGGLCTSAFALWWAFVKSEIRPVLNTPAPLRGEARGGSAKDVAL